MRTPNFTIQTLCEREGFKVMLDFEPEHMNARSHFINECKWSNEDYESIQNYYWFTAKVSAFKGNIECSSVYLGGCCYKNLKAIMNPEGDNELSKILSGYAPQMIDEAIEEAKGFL